MQVNNNVGWMTALEQLISSAFSQEPSTERTTNSTQRQQNVPGDTTQSNSFLDMLRGYSKQYTQSTLGNLKDQIAVNLGINRGADGTRQGLFSGMVDYIADSKVGSYLGIPKSAPITTTTAADVAKNAGSTVATVGTTASMGASIIGAGIGIYDYIRNYSKMDTKGRVVSGVTLGATIGASFGGPIGAGIGAVIGGIAGLFKTSGKPKDQKERDQMRKMLQQANVIDDKFTIGLADGSRFDIGIDGKARPEWGGRKYFEPDPQDPLAQKTFQVFQQVTTQLFSGNANMANSLAGYLTKAALSNAGGNEKIVQDNMKALISQLMGQQNQVASNNGQQSTQTTQTEAPGSMNARDQVGLKKAA